MSESEPRPRSDPASHAAQRWELLHPCSLMTCIGRKQAFWKRLCPAHSMLTKRNSLRNEQINNTVNHGSRGIGTMIKHAHTNRSQRSDSSCTRLFRSHFKNSRQAISVNSMYHCIPLINRLQIARIGNLSSSATRRTATSRQLRFVTFVATFVTIRSSYERGYEWIRYDRNKLAPVRCTGRSLR